MKKMVAIMMSLMMVVLTTSCGKNSGFEIKKTIDGYNVFVVLTKNPAIIGNNPIQIKVEDLSGKTVTDAHVMIEYTMPEMPGMPAMNYEIHAPYNNNTYSAVMNISMAGPWNIVVKIMKGEKTSIVRISIDAR